MLIRLAHLPHLSDQLVPRLDGAREAGLELLDVSRVAAAETLQDAVGGAVPREQAVDDGAAEAHLGAGLRRRVQRIVVAVEAVQQRGFRRRLKRVGRVRLLALRRRVVCRFGAWDDGRVSVYVQFSSVQYSPLSPPLSLPHQPPTRSSSERRKRRGIQHIEPAQPTLRPAPAPLPNIKPAPNRPRVDLAALRIHKRLFRLDHRPRPALVVHADDFAPDLEAAALGRHGQRPEERDAPLAVQRTARVELGHPRDRRAVRACVEVDHFLVRVLEW